jgi:hypothetical protein
MKRYGIYGHFTVGSLAVTGGERAKRVEMLLEILNRGLAKCASINKYHLDRQMRPWNTTRNDWMPEPDVVEIIEILGKNRDAVFVTYRNDPEHAGMVKELHDLGWARWQVVVCELPANW